MNFKNSLKITLVSILGTISLQAQYLPGNSFEALYKTKYPHLHYSYDNASQTHDYSANWDFDGDGKTDKLKFIGNGGVHLYFHLQVGLSSNRKTYDFPFLAIDLPAFSDKLSLKANGKPNAIPQFVVANFDADHLPEIYISVDDHSEIPKEWQSKGLTNHQLIVDYSKGELTLKNYQ